MVSVRHETFTVLSFYGYKMYIYPTATGERMGLIPQLTGKRADLVIMDDLNTIASCEPAVPTQEYLNMLASGYWVEPTKQEGEKPMNFDIPCAVQCAPHNWGKKSGDFIVTSVVAATPQVPIEATQRDFAVNRVWKVRGKLEANLSKQFFLDENNSPKTAKDLIKAIKEDDFSLDEKKLAKYEDDLHFYGSTFGINWGKNKPDPKGFDVALKALREETQNVIDTITLGSVEEGRQALKDFQNWTLPTSTTAD